MTTLVIDELRGTALTQVINITLQNRIQIAGIRPYIYMHNAPAGTFTFKIKSGANTIASQTFTSAEIKTDMATANNYVHIWKKLTFSTPIQLKTGAYTLELSSSGYTFSNSSYLAIIREHENISNTINGTPVSDFFNPWAHQLFGYVEAK